MYLTTTRYANAGDSLVATLKTTTVTQSNYHRKHLLFNGNVTVSFPNTNEPDEIVNVGDVWPSKDSYQLSASTFIATADVPGSLFYCIIPIKEANTIDVNRVNLDAGQNIAVNTGTVAFVFGDQYTVNDNLNAEKNVFACENSSAVIAAVNSCTVVTFAITPTSV